MFALKIPATINDDVLAATTAEAAIDAVSAAAQKIGLSGASCIYSLQPKDDDGRLNRPGIVLSGSFVRDSLDHWMKWYDDKGYFRYDAVYQACLTTTLPIVWRGDSGKQIVLGCGGNSKAAEIKAFRKMTEETGVRSGISVPIHGPDGGFGYVVYSSTMDADYWMSSYDDWCDYLLGLTHRFYHVAGPMFCLEASAPAKLTQRELDCLSLLAIGKTLDETGEILGLSFSTVRFHLGNAEAKLGVRSRSHAIAKAAFLGLLGRFE